MELAQRLWAIEQIKQLRHRAARLFDTRDYDAYEQLFTPDVVMRIVGQGEPYTIEGRQALMKTAREMSCNLPSCSCATNQQNSSTAARLCGCLPCAEIGRSR